MVCLEGQEGEGGSCSSSSSSSSSGSSVIYCSIFFPKRAAAAAAAHPSNKRASERGTRAAALAASGPHASLLQNPTIGAPVKNSAPLPSPMLCGPRGQRGGVPNHQQQRRAGVGGGAAAALLIMSLLAAAAAPALALARSAAGGGGAGHRWARPLAGFVALPSGGLPLQRPWGLGAARLKHGGGGGGGGGKGKKPATTGAAGVVKGRAVRMDVDSPMGSSNGQGGPPPPAAPGGNGQPAGADFMNDFLGMPPEFIAVASPRGDVSL